MAEKEAGTKGAKEKPGEATASEEPIPPQKWGEPLVRFDVAWTKFESRLCATVLFANVAALCVWVFLTGMSSEGNAAGVVFRALVGAAVLGGVAHKLTKKGDETRHQIVTTAAVIAGVLTAKVWSHTGVAYASNVLNWIQNASIFMLFGGLRTPGLATRLTLWLALLGASIATAQGKHINVDVLMRFLTPKMRIPVAIIGWVAAAVMCLAGAWGFFDHIVIQSFHAPKDVPCAGAPDKRCDLTLGAKTDIVKHDFGNDMFLVGRQLSLDLKTFPKVLGGTSYNQYMTPAEWNAWLKEADWNGHFKAEDVQALVAPPDMPSRMPAVSVPGGDEDARGLLTKDFDFVFVVGLFMIAMRFLLRVLLVLSGHVKVDPDAAHGDPDVADVHPAPEPATAGAKEEG